MTSHALRPPFDPELEKVLAPATEQVAASITLEMIPGLRSVDREAVVDDDDMLAEAGVERIDHTIAGYEGADIEVSVLRRTDHEGAGPGVCYVHGGGMVLGDRFLGLTQILPWVVRPDAVAVTVEYRLATEFPDPYPVEDSYAGLAWASEHAGELGIDPARVPWENKVQPSGHCAEGDLA